MYKTTGDKARDNRLMTVMQTLRDMIKNCDRQEQMGVPVGAAEKRMYALIGMAMKELLNKDQQEFDTVVAGGFNAIPNMQGGGMNPGLAQHVNQLADTGVMLYKQMVQQGIPPQAAKDLALEMVKKIEAAGLDPSAIAGVQVMKPGFDNFNLGTAAPKQSGQSLADLFEQTLKNEPDSGFTF